MQAAATLSVSLSDSDSHSGSGSRTRLFLGAATCRTRGGGRGFFGGGAALQLAAQKKQVPLSLFFPLLAPAALLGASPFLLGSHPGGVTP